MVLSTCTYTCAVQSRANALDMLCYIDHNLSPAPPLLPVRAQFGEVVITKMCFDHPLVFSL